MEGQGEDGLRCTEHQGWPWEHRNPVGGPASLTISPRGSQTQEEDLKSSMVWETPGCPGCPRPYLELSVRSLVHTTYHPNPSPLPCPASHHSESQCCGTSPKGLDQMTGNRLWPKFCAQAIGSSGQMRGWTAHVQTANLQPSTKLEAKVPRGSHWPWGPNPTSAKVQASTTLTVCSTAHSRSQLFLLAAVWCPEFVPGTHPFWLPKPFPWRKASGNLIRIK